MEYRKFGKEIYLRIDRGEEIVEKVKELAKKEDIRLARVSALGATNDFTVGVFDVEKKEYAANRFRGDHEIVSLTGTIDRMDGEVYVHLHLSAGNAEGKVFGGHLNRAVVSATCEMVVSLADGEVNRRFDGETGLNLFDFSD